MARFAPSLWRSARYGNLDGTSLRAVSEEDLLALLLVLGRGISDPKAFARTAIGVGGGLSGLADVALTSEARCLQTAVRIAEEVARRVAVERAQRCRLERPEDVAFVAERQLAGAHRECLLLLVCDSGNKLMQATVVTEGTADRLLIPVREVLSLVLQHGGRGFAVAHNHPSGDTSPSPADIDGTRALAAAATTVGLRFLGHVVVAGGQWQAVGSGEVLECGVDG